MQGALVKTTVFFWFSLFIVLGSRALKNLGLDFRVQGFRVLELRCCGLGLSNCDDCSLSRCSGRPVFGKFQVFQSIDEGALVWPFVSWE